MMLKNKSSKGRRTLALALVPAALAAVAVFNIPAVASVANELSNASWPQQESTPKVTKNLWKRRIKRDKCLRNACQ